MDNPSHASYLIRGTRPKDSRHEVLRSPTADATYMHDCPKKDLYIFRIHICEFVNPTINYF